MAVDYLKMLKRTDKLPVHVDLDTLDLYSEYLLNYDNRSINYSNLSNMRDYFDRISAETFKTNEAKMARYLFVTLYLKARLDEGIVKPQLAWRYVYDHTSKKYATIIERDIIKGVKHNNLNKKDIEFMNSMVYTQLNLIFMQDYSESMMKLLQNVKDNEFGKDPEDCDNAIRYFQSLLNELMKAQRKSKQENRFNLTDADHFNAMMMEAAERALSTSHYLQTGWQGLNKMLTGGFEDARVYNFIGATGGFKSGLLLNIMKQLKAYNKGRSHKDPTRRPTILFLSQENNVWETANRIYSIYGGTDIKKRTVKEILDTMKDGGFRCVQDDQDINLEFRYYGNMDIGVPDIKGIVEELDNSGDEVICVIQDYIERLRPPASGQEKRNNLIDISNQLHDLAIELDIPIITASQFNRDGVQIIEDSRERGRGDIAKKIGSGNISESFGMLKNFDMNIAIVIEYDSTECRYYLSFRILKRRGDDTGSIDYFLQPFVGKDAKIELMDDISCAPVYRLSMLDEVGAQIHQDLDEIQDISHRDLGFLEPLNDELNVDNPDEDRFFKQVFSDIDHSKVFQENEHRDKDGFIVLVRADQLLDMHGLNVHSAGSIC